jgi:ribonuclease P protein component
MLPKNSRLKKTKEIRNVLRNGRSFKERFLILKTTRGGAESRFGFVVPVKVSKKAVVRNKIKRRLRAIVAQNKKAIKKGRDSLLMALPGTEKETFSDLKQSLEKLLKKAGLYD